MGVLIVSKPDSLQHTKGFHQEEGIDFIETFSPMAKPRTIRIILNVTVVCKWEIRQRDLKNASLHGS